MIRVKKIRIKSTDEVLGDFKKAFHEAQLGVGKPKRPGSYFSSLETVRRIFTPERIKMLKHIKTIKPKSVYELAHATGRDMKNVTQDLKFLSDAGIVQMVKTKLPRSQIKPHLLAHKIELELVI